MPRERDYLTLRGELEWTKRNEAHWRKHAEDLENQIRDILTRDAMRGIDE